jgi:hypothetical protein
MMRHLLWRWLWLRWKLDEAAVFAADAVGKFANDRGRWWTPHRRWLARRWAAVPRAVSRDANRVFVRYCDARWPCMSRLTHAFIASLERSTDADRPTS